MAKKTKTGSINIPVSDFEDENITAHISIRLPLNLLKSLKKLSLNEHYEGRYQTLIRDVFLTYGEKKLRLKLPVSSFKSFLGQAYFPSPSDFKISKPIILGVYLRYI